MRPEQERQRAGETARGVALLAVPLLVIFLLTGMVRLLQHSRSADRVTDDIARPSVGEELRRVRAEFNRKMATIAMQEAQQFARNDLLPGTRQTVRDLVVLPLKRSRYRVRGTMVATTKKGQSITRRFEADLIHGPTDDRWRLIDTEFLP